MPPPPLLTRLRRLWEHDIWTPSATRERNLRSRGLSVLRIVSTTLSGLHELNIAARAAALTYSSLLGLGPLVALLVLISGMALGDRDPAIAANGINQVISFIAPPVGQYQKVADEQARDTPGGQVTARAANPVMVGIINNFITHSRSGTAGVVGVLALLIIVVLLFTSIEKTFNDIWGVRRGRNWITRLIYYWAVITLGAVVFFASLTLFSAGTVGTALMDRLPFHQELGPLYRLFLRSSSVLLLVLILTFFYRLVPNTRVKWRAALTGALVVTVLLYLNNYLAFLYFQNVVSANRLYGAVGILPLLMLGLYVFWYFVLVGGQLTYAVQNVHYRNSQTAWHSLNHATRESMSLLVLLLIARRFKACAPAYTVTELAHLIRVPAQILNESLNRLCDLKLIAELPPGEGADPTEHRYQPARPLTQTTLLDFQTQFENYGEAPSGGLLNNVDPVLAYYRRQLATSLPAAIGEKTLDQLLDELEPSRTYAPFPAKPPAA